METSDKHSRYVAHFDMLGFKSAVYRNHDEAWGALNDLRKAMDRIPAYGIKDATTEKDLFKKVHAQIFSDTIIVYSLSNEPEDLIAILMLSAQLYHDSLSLCVPLRGAISYGDFYINENLNLYCGKPLVEAHILSEGLQWSGIVVSDEVANNYFNTRNGSKFFDGAVLAEWDIFTRNFGNKKHWVINWPKIFKHAIEGKLPITVTQFYEPFKRMFGPYDKLRDHDKEKYTNTVNFINDIIKV